MSSLSLRNTGCPPASRPCLGTRASPPSHSAQRRRPRLLPAYIFSAAATLALLPPLIASAQLDVVITRSTQRAMPVAVVPLEWRVPLMVPVDLARTVEADLERTGQFAPLGRESMITRPAGFADMRLTNWRIMDVEAVVVGHVSGSENDLTIEVELVDVYAGRSMIVYRLHSSRDALRDAAHRIADVVYEQLTGARGIFSTRLAYVQVTPGREEFRLVVADADGRNPIVVLRSGESIMSPAWSPDGAQLAYVSFETGRAEVFVQEVATGQRRRLSEEGETSSAPAWSPDGRLLAVTKTSGGINRDIYLYPLEGGPPRRLTRHAATDTEPAFSADGAEVFFTSDRGIGPQVYVVSAAGGRARRVSFTGNYNARPRVQPNGGQLAVVHQQDGSFRIGLLDPADESLRLLTAGRWTSLPASLPTAGR